jgi:hypothetical protein
MSVQNELERFRRLLNLANTDVSEGRPDAALELVRPLISSIESHEGTVEWAELPLLIGYALTAKKEEGALAYLNDAQARIDQLYDPPIDLKVRVLKHLGNFYRLCVRRRATAREFYLKAKQLSDDAGFYEDSYKLQLRIRGIDLESDEDPLNGDFMTLISVGRLEGFTAKEQLEVWDLYYANTGVVSKKLKAARKFGAASEKYFLSLLRSKRNETSAQ